MTDEEKLEQLESAVIHIIVRNMPQLTWNDMSGAVHDILDWHKKEVAKDLNDLPTIKKYKEWCQGKDNGWIYDMTHEFLATDGRNILSEIMWYLDQLANPTESEEV